MQAKLDSSWWRNVASRALEERKQQPEAGKQSRKWLLIDELKACRKSLQRGKELHAEAMRIDDGACNHLATALINMYAKCGRMADARFVFDGTKKPNVMAWTALILGYAVNGEGLIALDTFETMKSLGCSPNSFSFVAALKACTSLANDQRGRAQCLQRGKQIHSLIGSHLDIYVQSSLIEMYANAGSMVDAQRVFGDMKHRNVVSWTALILGYADNGDGMAALDHFAEMKAQGCVPDSFTFVAALKACTVMALDQERAECLGRGKRIHVEIGSHSHVYVQNTLIDMYAKCGSMTDACSVFRNMKQPDIVSWNALISGYADNGDALTVLDLFARMRSQGLAPGCVTFVGVLKACGLLRALELGTKIHEEINTGTQMDTILVTCLVDFYAKCGNLVEAQRVFDCNPGNRDVKTWTALLTGYSHSGDSNAVFGLFQGMQFQPNAVTFLCILTCCSHAGLVEKASECFHAMSTSCGITPAVEHYNCMVDVLGRSNKLDDAMALLTTIPYGPDAFTWMSVLAASRKWRNVAMGRLAFRTLVCLDEANAAAYVLMAQLYGSRGMWQEQDKVLGMRNELQAQTRALLVK